MNGLLNGMALRIVFSGLVLCFVHCFDRNFSCCLLSGEFLTYLNKLNRFATYAVQYIHVYVDPE